MPLLASNFTSNLLYGTTIVAGGWANVDLTVDAFAFEGDKTFVVKLRKDSTNGQIISTSAPITIKDYTTLVGLAANISTVNEGNLVQFTLTTTNVVNYTNVVYSVFPVTANVTSADFVANTGYVTIVNNVGVFALQANADLSLMDETGETFRAQIRDKNNTNVFISSNITIGDVSRGVNVLGFTESSATTAEGGTLTLTFTATNANNVIIFYSTDGNATTSTFAGGNTGSFILNGISNTVTLLPTGVPYGTTQNFTVKLRSDTATGPVIATSNNLIVIDSSIAYINASGGTIEDSSGYRTHLFATSDNLTISAFGAGPSQNLLDYLVVAGGGGGGFGSSTNFLGGGGGGAGGLIQGSNAIITSSGTYNIVVGGGGAGGPSSPAPLNGGRRGGNSYIVISGANTQIAVGGGGGAGEQDTIAATPGGSGGGAGYAGLPAGSGVTGQGNPGGRYWGDQLRTAGGGGGAGSRGYAFDDNTGGNVNGGIGLAVNFNNFNIPSAYGQPGPTPGGKYFAGGGGGGRSPVSGGTEGKGGIGGGGRGGNSAGPWGAGGLSGNVYSGGGGGGGAYDIGGSGGSGIVLIRYPYVPSATVTNVITTASAFIVGSNITFTVNTLNANTVTWYYTTDGNVTLSNFIGSNTGSFVANASGGRVTLRANTNIPLNESRSFRLQIRQDSTTGFISGSSANVTIDGFASQISATGGTITTAGGYRTHTFLASNNFVLSKLSTDNIEYLIVAGGGSGGTLYGGGGGAGGMLYGNLTYQQISSGTYSMVVGAGGTSVLNGSNSSGLGILSIGGGAGGVYSFSPSPVDQENSVAKAGGSGGGAASGRAGYGPAPDGGWYGGLGIAGQGFAGGTRLQPLAVNYGSYESAGGGGAGGFGANVSVRTEKGGNGGIGVQWVNGTYYAGGGGGWGYQSPTADGPSYSNTPYTQSLGLGGLGGGGNGSKYYPASSPVIKFNSTSGTVNTGGGGGGHDTSGNPSPSEPGNPANSAGGSGVVIIRYPYV
jgi:hypothetical protein